MSMYYIIRDYKVFIEEMKCQGISTLMLFKLPTNMSYEAQSKYKCHL